MSQYDSTLMRLLELYAETKDECNWDFTEDDLVYYYNLPVGNWGIWHQVQQWIDDALRGFALDDEEYQDN